MNATTIIGTVFMGFVLAGSAFGQDAEEMIRQMDQAPPEKRPPGWEKTKALMTRKAPAVGDVAPDFTLMSLEGDKTVTRSKLPAGKPQVLIFGSYT